MSSGHKWWGDGDTVYCYTTETDETIGSDAFSDAFQSVAECVKHAREVNEKYMNCAHRLITIYKFKLELVHSVDISKLNRLE